MSTHHPVPAHEGALLASAGGVVGALARWGLTEAFPAHGVQFPWTVFAINLVGSALLAFLGLLPAVRRDPRLPVLLGTGVMGGFTTMSTASVDTFRLLDGGAHVTALLYAGGTLAATLVVAYVIVQQDPIGERTFETEEGDL